jgi:hypothetical protein
VRFLLFNIIDFIIFNALGLNSGAFLHQPQIRKGNSSLIQPRIHFDAFAAKLNEHQYTNIIINILRVSFCFTKNNFCS